MAELEYIELRDFTPGIYCGTAPLAPLGSAQETDTYACYGAPSGGLYPLYRRVGIEAAGDVSGEGFDTSLTYPTGRRKNQILDTAVISPYMKQGSETTSINLDDKHEAFAYITQIFNVAAFDGKPRRKWRMTVRGFQTAGSYQEVLREVGHRGAGPVQFVFHDLHASRLLYMNGALDVTVGDEDLFPAGGIGYVSPRILYSMGHTLWDDFTLANTDIELVPNDLVPPAFDPDEYLEQGGHVAVAHQGCCISIDNFSTSGFSGHYSTNGRFGANAEYLTPNDYAHTVPLSHALSGNELGLGSPEHRQLGSPGVVASLNANNLIMIGHIGGAVLVTGAFNNPTAVINLRGIPSTFGFCSRGVFAQDRFIYGTRQAVFALRGEKIELLSPQLRSGFLYPTPESPHLTGLFEFKSITGKFAYCNPFVFAPNNWVLDMRSGGWFRLSNPATITYGFFNTGSRWIYASPWYFDDTQTTLFDRYSTELGTDSFSWRSQPLPIIRNRRAKVRELTLTAQGTGTVTITLTGIDGATITHEFSVSSNSCPMMQTVSVGLTSHDIDVKIVSTGNTTAPTVHRLLIGYDPRQTV